MALPLHKRILSRPENHITTSAVITGFTAARFVDSQVQFRIVSSGSLGAEQRKDFEYLGMFVKKAKLRSYIFDFAVAGCLSA